MIASMVIVLISFGLRYSFGVFFNSLEAEFELSRAATSSLFSVYMLLACVVSIAGGWSLDKYGPKKVVLFMGMSTGLSLLLSSQASAAWQLYITYSVMQAFGTGALYTIANSTTSRWFVKKRGLAVGITSSAGGIGGVVLAPFSALLLLNFDWRISFIILGAVALIILIPSSRLLKRDPSEIGLLPDGIVTEVNSVRSLNVEPGSQQYGLTLSESCKTRQFWFIALIWLFVGMSSQMIITHLVPHIVDLDISAIDAAFVISLVSVGAILGRIIDGRLSDTVGRKPLAIVNGIIQIVALISLIFIRELWMFWVFALLFGYGWGGLGAQITLLVGDIFGLRSIGANMGTLTSSWNIGAAIGPAIGGLVFDITGNYSAAFAIAASGLLIATVFSILINPNRIKMSSTN